MDLTTRIIEYTYSNQPYRSNAYNLHTVHVNFQSFQSIFKTKFRCKTYTLILRSCDVYSPYCLENHKNKDKN